MMERYGAASAKVSRSCCTTQSAEGCRVTLKCRILRRPCSMMNKQYNTRKAAVGTVKRSRATMASRWLRRNASHLLPGSPRRWILQDSHLLAKGEDFDRHVSAALEEDASGGNQGEDEWQHGLLGFNMT